MSKREEYLRLLVSNAVELKDEELRKLSRIASYLAEINEDTTKDPALDLLIGAFRQFAESKGSVLYAILFREAGIGIQWFEEKRAGPKPSEGWREAEPGELLTMTYKDDLALWYKRGLVIYAYYPTLSEAIHREWSRLEEEK